MRNFSEILAMEQQDVVKMQWVSLRPIEILVNKKRIEYEAVAKGLAEYNVNYKYLIEIQKDALKLCTIQKWIREKHLDRRRVSWKKTNKTLRPGNRVVVY